MKIAVLGAGAWGTALAVQAARRHDVQLWARDAGQLARIGESRRNDRYLPGVGLPSGLGVQPDLLAAMAHAREGLLIVASPMSGLRALLQAAPADQAVVWLCKGFEAGSGALGHEIAREVLPRRGVAVLSGPSFAAEVARGQPTALVAASEDAVLCGRLVEALHGDVLRVYTSTDIVGVEVGGALKNVLAIAAGMLDGLGAASPGQGPGLNARAALLTRGLAEITRLGVALGARPDTFMGLSGLGDLVLTATGDLSRNRRLGLLLAEGRPLAIALEALGHVAEGAYTARTALDRARRAGVEMPITEAVVAVLESRLAPAEAARALMGRQSRAEA